MSDNPPITTWKQHLPCPIKEGTDATYYFVCNKGFDMDGSISRTCQANHKWNGTMTKCQSKLTKLRTSCTQSSTEKLSLHKIPKFHLISCCGNLGSADFSQIFEGIV